VSFTFLWGLEEAFGSSCHLSSTSGAVPLTFSFSRLERGGEDAKKKTSDMVYLKKYGLAPFRYCAKTKYAGRYANDKNSSS
jgi:hypothetical protein